MCVSCCVSDGMWEVLKIPKVQYLLLSLCVMAYAIELLSRADRWKK